MSYEISYGLDMGEGVTGLSFWAQVVDTDGTTVGADQEDVAVEIGNGYYLATPVFPTGHRGGIKFFDDSDTLVFFFAVNPEEGELIATVVSQTAGGSDSGGGAFSVTVTVIDGAENLLQQASVRIVHGTDTVSTGITNSEGVCNLSADAGEYELVISKGGYTYATSDLTVADNVDVEAEMTYSLITPSTAEQIIGFATLLDGIGQPAADETVTVTLRRTPEGVSGGNDPFTADSNVDGLVQVTVIKGATYRIQRGEGRRRTFIAPTEGTSFQLPDLVG